MSDEEKPLTWPEAKDAIFGIKYETWRAALEAVDGNITQAARDNGFKKNHGMKLTRRFELNEYAAKLRQLAWGRKHGRPPIS